MGQYQDRVVLVTGAASGIGFAVASAYLIEGARVALLDVRLDAVTAAAETLLRSDRAYPLAMDVRVAEDVERATVPLGTTDHLGQCGRALPERPDPGHGRRGMGSGAGHQSQGSLSDEPGICPEACPRGVRRKYRQYYFWCRQSGAARRCPLRDLEGGPHDVDSSLGD